MVKQGLYCLINRFLITLISWMINNFINLQQQRQQQRGTCLVVDPDETLQTDSGGVSHGDRQRDLPL